MTVTNRDAQALTYLAMRLRQDTTGAGAWDEHGTAAVIAKLIGQNLAISLERILLHATDADAKTPGSINRPFKPLKPSEKPTRAWPPKKADECPNHVGNWRENCSGCAVDAKAATYDGEQAASPPVRWQLGDTRAGAARAREGLRKVAGL